MYYATSYDEEGSPHGIRENLGPWEAVDKAAEELSNHQSAVRILKAHKLTVKQLSSEGGVVIINAEGSHMAKASWVSGTFGKRGMGLLPAMVGPGSRMTCEVPGANIRA
jgi:hypothetical protein